ncbi:nitroreductase family deazaflavin-dependent oxidoreductase [Actinoplanes sp. NPDC020271]|uniref:nitroreductase family deazaflavin-dependent oxidoreductase n=1 Tax=Actinoplanes sp. NPDC020271 TaxID=3363896 RepID=UPI0037B6B453
MTAGRIKRAWFWLLKHTLNRLAIVVVHRGWGPLSLIRHTGRRTGTAYETPLLLARTGSGFVAELTYGPDVAWLRNALASGCTVLHRGIEHRIDRIEPCGTEDGLRAFGGPIATVLRLARRREFRLLHIARR